MKENSKNIVPVLLGGDLNAYSAALAFRETYGVRSHAFMRYRCGATDNSKFIKTHICSGIDSSDIAVSELLKFKVKYSDSTMLLVPCGDSYVRLLTECGEALLSDYRFLIPEREHFEMLSDKASFAEKISEFGIPHPEYVTFSSCEEISSERLEAIPHPAVVKASSSTEYYKHPFDGMKKVYFTDTYDESRAVIKRIFSSGYDRKVILQRRIGSDNKNRVMTTFSDKYGQVVRAVLGDVILEEVGKSSFGNHSAIITRPLDRLAFSLIDFLNGIKYKGFANFDIMCDADKQYVLEMNLRQGRSCDHLRGAGMNIARLLVDAAYGNRIQADFRTSEIYWHYPPHKTVMRLASPENARLAERLRRRGREYTPYKNHYEGARGHIYAFIHGARLDRTIIKDFEKRNFGEAFGTH